MFLITNYFESFLTTRFAETGLIVGSLLKTLASAEAVLFTRCFLLKHFLVLITFKAATLVTLLI